MLTGCSRIDVSELPPVPRIETSQFLPGVQRQLADAYRKVDDKPASIDANGHLAMLLQTYKQFSHADTMYQRVRALDADSFQWAYLHGLVLGAVGKPEQAIEAFRQALTLRDDYPLAKIHLADHLATRGDVTAADRLFADVMQRHPGLSEAHFSYGRFLLREGRPDLAIAEFGETLRLSGDLGVAYYQLGLAYREQGDLAKARKNFALAQKYEGTSADSNDPILNQLLPLNLSDTPFIHRAKMLAQAGRMDEAEQFIRMALERNPQSAAAHASMIGMAASRKQFSVADEHFARAVALEPDNAKIYFNLGMARIAEERWVEGARAFEKSLQLDDTDPNAHVQFAVLKHKQRQLDTAERHLRSALALDPLHPTGNWLLGELLLDQGKANEALPYLQKALGMNHPFSALIHALAAEAYVALGQPEQATRMLSEAERLVDTNTTAGIRARISAVAEKIALDDGK